MPFILSNHYSKPIEPPPPPQATAPNPISADAAVLGGHALNGCGESRIFTSCFQSRPLQHYGSQFMNPTTTQLPPPPVSFPNEPQPCPLPYSQSHH